MEKALTALVGFVVGLLSGGSGGDKGPTSGDDIVGEGNWLTDMLGGPPTDDDHPVFLRRTVSRAVLLMTGFFVGARVGRARRSD